MADQPIVGNGMEVHQIVEGEDAPEGLDIIVDGVGDLLEHLDGAGNVTSVELPDGGVEVYIGGRKAGNQDADAVFGENLAMDLDSATLGQISSDLLAAIQEDESSRADWLEIRAEGLKLLALKLEKPSSSADSNGSVEGMSRVRHPMLLEAVIRFQANARGELLPSDGPVKVRNDQTSARMGHNGGPPLDDEQQGDSLAEALEKDLNHYLTAVATEYYPDTDKMLFMTGFGGDGFKKIYNCPLRQRPVSESVDAADLIVSDSAVDLASARVTHRIMMKPSTLKRMQIIGNYRNINLGDAGYRKTDAAQDEKNEIQGVAPSATKRQGDLDREIYESYCELDIPGHEHCDAKGKPTGLPLPYKVTIDTASQEVLEIRANYDVDDPMCMPKRVFVKYPFIPGLGFYDIGLVHILGGSTMAVTAAWREMLDAGMFASFPGFLYAKAGGRQNSMTLRVPPGGGVAVETGGKPISDAVMPLPYKDPSAGLTALVENIIQTASRVGGTAEVQVGEGRQDAPVGTTIALIEQATKPMDAVHKRLHAAQSEEFQILRERFREDPEALWRHNKRAVFPRDKEKVLQALDDYDLVPMADPNTSSRMMRIMKAVAIKQIAMMAPPGTYDMREVDSRIYQMIDVSDYEALFAPPQQQQPDPKAQTDAITAQAKMVTASAAMMNAKGNAAGKLQQSQDAQADNATKERIATLNVAKELAVHPSSAPIVHQQLSALPSGGVAGGPPAPTAPVGPIGNA
jgi:hypothetical protein